MTDICLWIVKCPRATFYAKRVRDFNDAARADGGFTETSPFVGITDAGLQPGAGTGPIGWETYQPVTQLWLYKYYGDTATMQESFNATYGYIQVRIHIPSLHVR
jgi:hypothetical protein